MGLGLSSLSVSDLSALTISDRVSFPAVSVVSHA